MDIQGFLVRWLFEHYVQSNFMLFFEVNFVRHSIKFPVNASSLICIWCASSNQKSVFYDFSDFVLLELPSVLPWATRVLDIYFYKIFAKANSVQPKIYFWKGNSAKKQIQLKSFQLKHTKFSWNCDSSEQQFQKINSAENFSAYMKQLKRWQDKQVQLKTFQLKTKVYISTETDKTISAGKQIQLKTFQLSKISAHNLAETAEMVFRMNISFGWKTTSAENYLALKIFVHNSAETAETVFWMRKIFSWKTISAKKQFQFSWKTNSATWAMPTPNESWEESSTISDNGARAELHRHGSSAKRAAPFLRAETERRVSWFS